MRNIIRKDITGFNKLTLDVFNALVGLYNHMIRRLALASVWIVIAPAILLTLAVVLSTTKNNINLPQVSTQLDIGDTRGQNIIEAQVIAQQIEDPRPFVIERFLTGTPLEPYSAYIVEVSDKYSIDYRLIPAIAMKESGGGTTIDPASHNAWGFENGQTYFPSWEYAIDRVASTLKNSYVSKGLTTPEQIMAKYAPPQLETGGKWARDINHFYSQMETL
ncbi:MAG: hypothetical protein UU23_C0001G0098 [Candidatus Curtissbacteria bacterium GW2011_GWA1_40_9]|uniref:Mannosyl-glycoprotein endo-beta-N-acetylglucosamidase-like domain-containing protein n=1 Tax=Candidatus Curtissbacteria bacterium GW2011_GWA1_40_9 TaxID=1618408 RepID=A0A0G0TMR5_9BACT|nr:MAG: hypothetical protein UU23_C0001G0098 [Candidatus Curtissbacteria bacterium GW2011_GWA1_40_9]